MKCVTRNIFCHVVTNFWSCHIIHVIFSRYVLGMDTYASLVVWGMQGGGVLNIILFSVTTISIHFPEYKWRICAQTSTPLLTTQKRYILTCYCDTSKLLMFYKTVCTCSMQNLSLTTICHVSPRDHSCQQTYTNGKKKPHIRKWATIFPIHDITQRYFDTAVIILVVEHATIMEYIGALT